MATISYPVNSTTLTLNGHVFSDYAEGDFITLAPVNPATSRVNGTNGVSIQQRSDGKVHDMTVNIRKNSVDDAWLNSQRKGGPVVFNGSMKTLYERDGSPGAESVTLEAGSVTGQPTEVYNSTDGNAMMSYTIQFFKAERNL